MKQLVAALVAATFSIATLAQGNPQGTVQPSTSAAATTAVAPVKADAQKGETKKTKKKKAKKQPGAAHAPAASPVK